MVKLLCVLSLLLTLTGCLAPPPVRTFAPQTEVVQLPAPPDVAYRQAVQALVRFGGVITTQDKDTRIVTAQVHSAVNMTVMVEPQGTGSVVTVTGVIPPTKITVGEFTEVQDYVVLLKQER